MPARMRKLKIITLNQYTDSLISALHEEGLVSIQDISERIQQDAEMAKFLKPSKVTPETGRIASLLMKTTGISDFLTNVAPKRGLVASLKEYISPTIFDKREVEQLDSKELIKRAEATIKDVESITKDAENKLSALDSEKNAMEMAKTVSEKLIKFDVDLADLQNSKYTAVTTGKISSEGLKTFKDAVTDITDNVEVLEEDSGNTDKTIIVITLKEFEEKINTLLRKSEFEKFEIVGLSGKPNEVIKNSESRLKSISSERQEIITQLQGVSEEWGDKLLVLKEQLEIEKERNEIHSSFVETEKTVMLEAWVAQKKEDNALSLIEKETEGYSVVESVEPTDDDDVPVLMDNPRFAQPYETFVEMYSPLRYNEIDPTIFMAVVFPFFFGFCLTDAGYGIFVSLIGLILWRGMGKISKFMHDFGLIFISCGIWAFILGMAFNGFIGDFFPRWLLGAEPLPTTISALDAFVNPHNILIMALITGFIHVNFGLILGIINNLRAGDKKAALGDQIVWILIELGVILIVAGVMAPALGFLLYVGILVILAALGAIYYCNGAFGLMDVSGFLGTLLSYARLLALCLSTGGIAMTVNILAGLSWEMIPYIGVVLSPIIFIVGHIANFAFQVLGAFINSLRLHYVEFFAQFYMSGKNKFEAFRAERSFTKIRR